jgi:hypothetical protein
MLLLLSASSRTDAKGRKVQLRLSPPPAAAAAVAAVVLLRAYCV